MARHDHTFVAAHCHVGRGNSVAVAALALASRARGAYTARMSRNDLLALTDTDLADISNRGSVGRARKELEQGRVSYELSEVDGTVTVHWSDGRTTVLPAGRVLAEAECSCTVVGMCRHIVRAVLAYQAEHEPVPSEPGEAPRNARPWDPGEITDAELESVFSSRRLAGYRDRFDEGLVVELVRSAKPLARFHRLRHTLRFLVPGDVRYTQCDCAEPAPCMHAALAVWAFRGMGEGDADIVVTGEADETVDLELLARVEAALIEATRVGFANMPGVTMDGWRRLEQQLRTGGLVWPAEILGALRRQHDHYQSHDARFSPDILAGLVGELLIRFDALRKDDVPVPRLFIRGDQADVDAKLGGTRLVGLGCAVQMRHRSVEIEALLQDASTGTVVGVSRSFADDGDAAAPPEGFSGLARRLAIKGRNLWTIGSSQIVIKSATLHSDHELSLGRSTATVYAQRFAWEDLRAPVAAESFAEVRARLSRLPPASLRPRRLGEDLHVVRIAGVESAHFSEREQAVRAVLIDTAGHRAHLRHPYMTRNREGTERLLSFLTSSADRLLFVAGTYRLAASGLVIAPTGLVFEAQPTRVLVQPWVDDMDAELETSTTSLEPPTAGRTPLDRVREGLAVELGAAVLAGTDGHEAARDAWETLGRLSEALHLASITQAIGRYLAAEIGGRAEAVHDLAVLSKLAEELG